MCRFRLRLTDGQVRVIFGLNFTLGQRISFSQSMVSILFRTTEMISTSRQMTGYSMRRSGMTLRSLHNLAREISYYFTGLDRKNQVSKWKNIKALLKEHYKVGSSKEGADVYPL